MQFAVYLEVTNKRRRCVAVCGSQHTHSRIVSLLRSAIRCIVPYKTTPRLCGRLTSLQKVSLPLCKTLPLCHLMQRCLSALPNLLPCCLQPAPPNRLLFFIVRQSIACLFSRSGGMSSVTRTEPLRSLQTFNYLAPPIRRKG